MSISEIATRADIEAMRLEIAALKDMLRAAITDRVSGQQSEYMTREDVAQHLRISTRTVDAWARLGRLKKTYETGVPRFKRSELPKL